MIPIMNFALVGIVLIVLYAIFFYAWASLWKG